MAFVCVLAREDSMDSKYANCWLCDRPVEPGQLIHIFPSSGIPFHTTCLNEGGRTAGTAGSHDSENTEAA